MAKQFLDKLGLEELIKNIIALDSAGDAIEIKAEDHHKILSVKFDGETIVLSSEGELTLPLDYETIFLSSEGLLKARPEALESGIATEVYYNSEGKEVVDVKLDGKTIILDSEGNLQTQVGGWLESTTAKSIILTVAESTVDPYAPPAQYIWPLGSEAGEVAGLAEFDGVFAGTIDGVPYNKTLRFTDAGTYFSAVDPDTGYTYRLNLTTNDLHGALGGTAFTINPQFTLSYHRSASEVVHPIDSKFISIDGTSIILDSEGKLKATFQAQSAEAPIRVNSEGKISLDFDKSTLVLDSEGVLNVPLDGVTLVMNATNKIEVAYDNDTIVLNSEGKLSSGSVFPDEKTIIKDANKVISVPIDEDTIVVTSEGKVVSPRAFLNDIELKGKKTSRTTNITWFGTKDQYDAIAVKNPETIYIVDSSEGYVPAIPDYNAAKNKPKVNHVELSGDKSLADLGIQGSLNGGTSMSVANDTVNLKYHPGVLAINTSNELFADTYTSDQIENMIGSMRTIKVVNIEPTPASASPNTLYYVSTGEPSVYNVFLFDSDKTKISLGTSNVGTYTPGDGISIDVNNVISATMDTSIDDTKTNQHMPSTKAVYDFVMQGASATNDGERGIVPQPVAGDQDKLLTGAGTWASGFGGATSTSAGTSGAVPAPGVGGEKALLRGDNSWAQLVNDCVTDADNQPLAASQGKAIGDRLGTDIPWTKLTTTASVSTGEVYYMKKNNVVTINFEGVQLVSPQTLNVGTAPADIRPNRLLTAVLCAYNNANSPAGCSIATDGLIKLYGNTGAYKYYGTLTYTI